MRTSTIIVLSFALILSTLLLWVQPTAAQNHTYAPGLYPDAFNTSKLHWRISNVTDEVVEFGFGSGTFWQAQAGHAVSFEIQEIANYELTGLFTIGNLTLPTNDSRIAAELVFSIWPWFPGLVSHLDWNTVDQAATEAAASFFMNGSLDIHDGLSTKTYNYHQGPWGNQNTTLVYDINSGILLSAYTEFFFLNDYHLGIDFVALTQNPTELNTLLFVGAFGVVLALVFLGLVISRARSKKG
jgi:hypothetical protein